MFASFTRSNRALPAIGGLPLLLVGVLAIGNLGLAGEPQSAGTSVFHKPVRLRAGDSYIDTGEAWGHSGPWLADVYGKGKRDLIVGDFSGLFRIYQNIGTNQEPRYLPHTFLMAGSEQAKVPIY